MTRPRAEDRIAGIVYLYRPNQALMKKLMPIVANELMRWFNRHPITQDFLHRPAKTGFFEFLVDRPDIAAMLRIIDKQPPDVTAYEDPSIITVKTQTAAQTLVETAISFVPLVGEVVAAYEAFSAKDLFDNKLNSLDRGILGAAIFLPMMGMVVKDGRAVYTETRLVQLYGRTADEWSHAIDAVGRIEAKDLKVLAEAEEALRLRKSLEPALARRAAAALPGLAKPAGLLQSSVDKVVSEAFATLRSAHPIFDTLDEFALLRILEKGPHPDLIKGQLLEELIESRIVGWLADRNAYLAPRAPETDQAGQHRDLHSRPHDQRHRRPPAHRRDPRHLGEQRADHPGDLRGQGRQVGRAELRIGKGGISSLSDTERAALEAEVQRVYRTLKRRAELEGTTFTKKIEDIRKEVIEDIRFSETGGQVRRDVERLYEDEAGRPRMIYIGDRPKPVPVRISPTKTKFLGILPADIDPTFLREVLTRLGYSFEVIGAAILAGDLKTIADRLIPLAEKLAAAPK